MKKLSDPTQVADLQWALHESQALSFELLTCAIEKRLPSADLLAHYSVLMDAADRAALAYAEAME